jgi:uncharacterized protein YceK
MKPRASRLFVTAALMLAASGCGSVLDDARGEPSATPTNFNGLVEQLAAREFSVANVVSGDPGCSVPVGVVADAIRAAVRDAAGE